MLRLNKEELETGVQFEAKKYIPFKSEELISDYQHRVNKKTVKMDIFYVAAIKGVLERIIDALERCGLQVIGVEPAIFSLFRLLVMTKQFDPEVFPGHTLRKQRGGGIRGYRQRIPLL